MGTIRDKERTRARILDAAAKEFSAKGFDGTALSEIARRARVSKQLIHHHFRRKEALFQAVHDLKFRPSAELEDLLPRDPADLLAEHFWKRAGDTDYIRFLTWEAASGRGRTVPGHDARQRRIAGYGTAIRLMQVEGKLPADLDSRLMHLAILALATYPMAFAQITKLVTGHAATDPAFKRAWRDFLRRVGKRLFSSEASGRLRS